MNAIAPHIETRTVLVGGKPTEVMNAATVKRLLWTTHTPQAKKLRKLVTRKEIEIWESNPLMSAEAVSLKALMSVLEQEVGLTWMEAD